MDSDDIVYTVSRLVIEGIAYLSECYSQVSSTTSELGDYIDTAETGDTLERHRLECITDEDRHSLTILFPDSWESTTQYIVVHTWEIIMYEGIAVHELDPDEPIDDSIRTYSVRHMLICEDREYRTQPLATSLYGMSESGYELSLNSYNNSSIATRKKSRQSILDSSLVCGKPME